MTAKSPTILDCTLRDGGYYTTWDFSDKLVDTYLRSAAKLPISIVELGYANLPRDGYFGQYYFLTRSTTERAKSLLRRDQKLAIMLDEKVAPPTSAYQLVGEMAESVDIVRMAVAPDRLANAVELSGRIREMGFKVGINVMYLSRYWDKLESLDALADAAAISSCISLVDSYGACAPNQTAAAVSRLKELCPDATVGFHGHDNLGLAFANSLSAIDAGASVIDGTVTGMGRGPGNTRTETLLVHSMAERPDELNYVALHDVVQPFEALKHEYGWGTNLVYMISGAADLPQNRVMDWLGKNRYSVPAIIHAMQNESLGNVDSTEYPSLPAASDGQTEVIVVGGGPSMDDHGGAVLDYAEQAGSTVVHANYRHLQLIERIGVKQFVALAGDVVDRLPTADKLAACDGFVVAAAPRIRAVPQEARDRTYQIDPFVAHGSADHLGSVSDIGPLSLALGAAIALGASQVTLVGFDGYAHATSAEQELAKESQNLLDDFRQRHPGIRLTSATRTRYDVPVTSIYSRLARA